MEPNSNIDLAFIMDCTSSMGSYIKNAKDNINKISDELIRSEKCRLRIALVEYRDHPPQERTFVTRINDFTDDIAVAKKFISKASALGGGDLPESICCAMYDCLNNLNWSANDSVKIAILIADAPPHGLLDVYCDQMKEGCPKHNDPIEIAHKMAERAITLYTAGVEPPLQPYRVFFQALCLITGGKYVPLDQAENLSTAIIGGTREEVSMERLMAQVHEEVMKEAADKGEAVNEDVLTKRIHALLNSQGSKVNKVVIDQKDIEITDDVKEISKCKDLKEINDYLRKNNIKLWQSGSLFDGSSLFGTSLAGGSSLFGGGTSSGGGSSLFGGSSLTAGFHGSLFSSYTPIDFSLGLGKPVGRGRGRRVPARKTTSTKRTPVKKATVKTEDSSSKGPRRSRRLAGKEAEKESPSTDTEEEKEEVKVAAAKVPKLTKKSSSVSITADENVDMDLARRLVKKSIARNKLGK